MDKLKAPVPASPQGEPGDIDIFLFSNGETLAPPRKYHLTAQELNRWESTLNFLARSHYGYLHSSIDLYTIDGTKVGTPLELTNNNTYVAVEAKDTFLPGGYDQYLMRASKSWIKRYGSVSSSITSREKITTGTAIQSETTANNTKLEKVTEVKEIKEVEENTTEVITTALINEELNETNKNPETSKAATNNNVQKPEEKKKTTPRSSILRKNITNIHANGKNSVNTKDKPPLKKRPGSPPSKNSNNKVSSQRKESLVKALYSPGRAKNNFPQMANKNSAISGSNTDPEFMISAKLSCKPETQVQSEPIGNEMKKLELGVDQDTKDEQYYEFIKQILPPLDDILKRDISIKEYPGNEAGEKVTDALEAIEKNVDGCYELTRNKKINDDSALTKSFSTEIQHGEVIKLRLSLEVKQSDNKSNEETSPPVMNNDLWSIVIQEKSSQVNMDEIVFQKETLKSILEELQNKEPDSNQKYVILHCDCCNNYYHEKVKLNEEPMNIQSSALTRVRNKKDYVVLLPYIKPDDDLFGCKCDDAVPKSDKIMQTSIIFDTSAYTKGPSVKQTVDKATDAPRESLDETTDFRPQHRFPLCNRSCGTSEVLFHNEVSPTLPPSKESRNVSEPCPSCSSAPKALEVPTNNITCSPPPPPKGKAIDLYDCPVCTNKPKGIAMVDKSTQTDTYCFLLEARRGADGHYSFHLPPLHRVKLYRY